MTVAPFIGEWVALLHAKDDPWKAMAMLMAYFDESGTHARSKITSIAGFVADAAAWGAWEDEWRALLEKLDVPYFHMTDCVGGFEHFQKYFSKPEIRIFAEKEALAIIGRHKPMPIWSAIVREDWDDLTTPEFRDRYPAPYYLCFEHCLQQIASWSRREKNGMPVALVFSQQNQYREHANDVYRAYDGGAAWAPLAGLTFANMRYCLPLQAADVLAYAMNKDMEGAVYAPGDLYKFVTNTATNLAQELGPVGLHSGGCFEGVGLMNAVSDYQVSLMDETSQENFRRLRAARPGDTIDIMPYPAPETGRLVVVDRCPGVSTPHLHTRESGACHG